MSSLNHQMCQIRSCLHRGTNSTIIDLQDKCKRCLGHVKSESCLMTTTESTKMPIMLLTLFTSEDNQDFDICPSHFVLCGDLLKRSGLPYNVKLESNGYFSSMPVQPGLFAPSVTCTLPFIVICKARPNLYGCLEF